MSRAGGNLILEGYVAPGRNIAAVMVADNSERLKHLLGVAPFPGTLNVVMNAPLLLKNAAAIDMKEKRFAISGLINNVPCLVYRWHNAPLHIFEIVAPVHLRTALSLENGQKVRLNIGPAAIGDPGKRRTILWRFFYEERPEAYYNDKLYRLFTTGPARILHKMICQKKREFT